jgi:hypothetical protein
MVGDDRGDLAAFRAVEDLAAGSPGGLRVAVRSAESPRSFSTGPTWWSTAPRAFATSCRTWASAIAG